VHSDTRTLRAGDLFVALKGERFDAHDFLAQAGQAGAVAALAQRGLAEAGLPACMVADTQRALARWPRTGAALRAAADRGDRQQRQDHRHADDRVDPARLAGDAAFCDRRAISTTTSACRSRCCACARTANRRTALAWSSSA
jgi:hypothetical protein